MNCLGYLTLLILLVYIIYLLKRLVNEIIELEENTYKAVQKCEEHYSQLKHYISSQERLEKSSSYEEDISVGEESPNGYGTLDGRGYG